MITSLYDEMLRMLKPDGQYARVDGQILRDIEAAGELEIWHYCQDVCHSDAAAIDKFLEIVKTGRSIEEAVLA